MGKTWEKITHTAEGLNRVLHLGGNLGENNAQGGRFKIGFYTWDKTTYKGKSLK